MYHRPASRSHADLFSAAAHTWRSAGRRMVVARSNWITFFITVDQSLQAL